MRSQGSEQSVAERDSARVPLLLLQDFEPRLRALDILFLRAPADGVCEGAWGSGTFECFMAHLVTNSIKFPGNMASHLRRRA